MCMSMVLKFVHEIREEMVGGNLFYCTSFNYLTIPFTRKNDTTINVLIRILELFCLHSFELKYVNA